MAFAQHVWNQLKSITAGEIVKALERDGWTKDPASQANTLAYIKGQSPRRRVVIHFHPKKTYGSGLLKDLLQDIGWTEDDLRRLKLVK